MTNLKVSKEFTSTPGPRYRKEGTFSGQQFREDFLLDAIRKAIESDEILVVDLDGTAGYGTSFLEEAFGGLIRENNLELSVIDSHFEIISTEEEYLIDDISEYLKNAEEQHYAHS